MKRCDGQGLMKERGQGGTGLMMQGGGNSIWEKAHCAADQNRLRHENVNVNVNANVNMNMDI